MDRNEGSVLKGEDEVCWIRRRDHGKVIQAGYHESKLRRASFLRWLFHRNPDGSFQVGNNPLWAFLFACCAFGYMLWTLRGEVGVYPTIGRVLCIGTIPAWLWFTGRQYLGLSR